MRSRLYRNDTISAFTLTFIQNIADQARGSSFHFVLSYHTEPQWVQISNGEKNVFCDSSQLAETNNVFVVFIYVFGQHNINTRDTQLFMGCLRFFAPAHTHTQIYFLYVYLYLLHVKVNRCRSDWVHTFVYIRKPTNV